MPADDSAMRVELLDGGTTVLSWPLSDTTVDVRLVDALARLQIAAKRFGWTMRVRDADAELVELVELVGLTEVLALEPSR